jgi:hypothetical protein
MMYGGRKQTPPALILSIALLVLCVVLLYVVLHNQTAHFPTFKF